MAAPGFWDDIERAQRVNQKVRTHENKIAGYETLQMRLNDLADMCALVEEEQDMSLVGEVQGDFGALEAEITALELELLLTGPYDSLNAILSLHAGAGGTEAQDWVSMLYRMYVSYAQRKGYQVNVLDMLDGDEAGIKSVTFEVAGENAYGFLKAERGVHRLVRISPFDSSARRHTSFASLDVAPMLEDEGALVINTEDLRIDTYRAGGAGGQHVNRTDSAVRITHLPTGIVVQCQNERSQIQNRETAMKMLRSKLVEVKERESLEKMQDIKGEMKKIEWGSQIRSYVFQPYTMVKDHRTGFEMGSVDDVMNGKIDGFITAFLQMST